MLDPNEFTPLRALMRATEKAQIEANRSKQPMSLINLNTVGQALYVVRTYNPDHETGRFAHQFVAKITPQY